MKKRFFSLLLALAVTLTFLPAIPAVALDEVITFPDANFEAFVREVIGKPTGNIFASDVAGITMLIVTSTSIADLTGIEYFTALTHLHVGYNQLTELDVSNNTALTWLWAFNNKLTTIDVSNNTALRDLHVSSNQLTTLDVSKNTALTDLNVSSNQLTTLDVSKNTALTDLNVYNNQLTELDVRNNAELWYLGVGYTQLTELDVSNNTALTWLQVGVSQLTELDVSNNTALAYLHAHNNQLTALDVSNNTALIELHAHDNRLTTLDVSNNTELTSLGVDNNQLTELDVRNNTALTYLWVSNNQLKTLDVSKNTELTDLVVSNNQLKTLDVTDLPLTSRLWVQNNYLPNEAAVIGFTGTWDDYDFRFDPQRSPPPPVTCDVCDEEPCVCEDEDEEHKPDACQDPDCEICNPPAAGGSGIDYSADEVVVPGKTFSFKSGKEVPADAALLSGAEINLTRETFNIPAGHTIEAYSTDGGMTWKAGSLTEAQVIKMLNKGMELWLCTKDYNKNAKKPQGSGNEHNIIAFAKINKRPTALKLVINYAIAADATGATPGAWVLTEKNGTAAVKENIQVGVASGKTVDANGYGQFFSGAANGIPVVALTGAKPAKTTYFIRTAPSGPSANGEYTAAGKAKKINVAGEQKTPSFKVTAKAEKGSNPATAIIKVKAGTYVSINGGEPALYATKADVDVLSVTGTIELWLAATAKKPATAKQTLTR
ncbi:MAG: hypothetical protein FWG72_01440 [Oscillospiraceae bacterium]|nr:hypothetical protein [Oscillospiraceae bacterium]